MESDDEAPAWQSSHVYRSPIAQRPPSPEAQRPLMPLAPGDILMLGQHHAVMWVGGAKPVVHSVNTMADGGHTKGALRQSDDYLAKTEEYGLRVFRYMHNAALGAKAADFAIEWATESNSKAAPAPDAFSVDETAQIRVLKTPYSQKRRSAPADKPELRADWSVDALFRVIKAVARARDKAGLSPNHGVSCDQFVVFCYQAAALEQMHGGSLPAALIQRIRSDVAPPKARPFDLKVWAMADDHLHNTPPGERTVAGGLWRDRAHAVEQKVFKSLKSAPDRALIVAALSSLVDPAGAMMPKPMRRDAKTGEIGVLLRDLRAQDSGFRELGTIKSSGDGFGIAP